MRRAGILALALWVSSASAHAEPARVVDGDTIRVGAERVRIFGLDCPERRAPGGHAATELMRALVDGHPVRLERCGRDRFGRTVARVYIGEADVAKLMIDSGHCREYCKFSKNAYGSCK